MRCPTWQSVIDGSGRSRRGKELAIEGEKRKKEKITRVLKLGEKQMWSGVGWGGKRKGEIHRLRGSLILY